jgi:hypothetical protein
MDLVAQARGFGKGGVAFGDEQVKHGGVIIRSDAGQGRRFFMDQLGDGMRIEAIALTQLHPEGTRPSPPLCRPAGINLIDGFALRHEELG